MGRKVIQQPNGKYAIFSTIVDDFILVNATQQEIIDHDVEESREQITERYTELFGYFDRGENPPPYLNGSNVGWNEVIQTITEVHGVEMAASTIKDTLGE